MSRRILALGTVAVITCGAAVAVTALPAQAASPIQITAVRFDSAGTDTGSNRSLNGEYVVIKNTGSTPRALTQWTLTDETGYRYTFPTTTLAAGSTLRVRTGQGTDSRATRYWGRGWYVWNNTADRATLRNHTGVVADRCGWPASHEGSVKYCPPPPPPVTPPPATPTRTPPPPPTPTPVPTPLPPTEDPVLPLP